MFSNIAQNQIGPQVDVLKVQTQAKFSGLEKKDEKEVIQSILLLKR